MQEKEEIYIYIVFERYGHLKVASQEIQISTMISVFELIFSWFVVHELYEIGWRKWNSLS